MDIHAIGQRIQKARKSIGMTQEELAQFLDMTPKYISNIECGEKMARLETFVSIANVLRVDANTLLQDVLDNLPHDESLAAKVHLLPKNDRERLIRMIDAYIGNNEN